MRRPVSTWRKLHEAGLASEVADAIIRTQPFPLDLLRVLLADTPRAGGSVQKSRGSPRPSEGRDAMGRFASGE